MTDQTTSATDQMQLNQAMSPGPLTAEELGINDIMTSPAFPRQNLPNLLPPAIHPRSTKAERKFAHKARMEGKRYDRIRKQGQTSQIRYRADLRRLVGVGSIAEFNRHTGKPHEHAREIMRNTMTIAERRAFTAKVAAHLGIAA